MRVWCVQAERSAFKGAPRDALTGFVVIPPWICIFQARFCAGKMNINLQAEREPSGEARPPKSDVIYYVKSQRAPKK